MPSGPSLFRTYTRTHVGLLYLLPPIIVRIACSAAASAQCTRIRCIDMTAAAQMSKQDEILPQHACSGTLTANHAEPETVSATARRTHAFSERIDLMSDLLSLTESLSLSFLHVGRSGLKPCYRCRAPHVHVFGNAPCGCRPSASGCKTRSAFFCGSECGCQKPRVTGMATPHHALSAELCPQCQLLLRTFDISHFSRYGILARSTQIGPTSLYSALQQAAMKLTTKSEFCAMSKK